MAKKSKSVKTNAVRILESKQAQFEVIEYTTADGEIDGISVASKIGQTEESVFKTLVTLASARELFVFLIPVNAELSLKKAAKIANVKKLEMLPLKDLFKETGYIRGGCSAVGMKKSYPTFIDRTAENLEEMVVSAGKPGLQMKLKPTVLKEITAATFGDLLQN